MEENSTQWIQSLEWTILCIYELAIREELKGCSMFWFDLNSNGQLTVESNSRAF